MTQTIITLIKENFLLLLEKWEKRPFVILSLILLAVSIFLGKSLFDTTKAKNNLEINHMRDMDSLKTENTKLMIQLSKSGKYENYNAIIDSTLETLFRNNLLKNTTNEKD